MRTKIKQNYLYMTKLKGNAENYRITIKQKLNRVELSDYEKINDSYKK